MSQMLMLMLSNVLLLHCGQLQVRNKGNHEISLLSVFLEPLACVEL